MGIERTLGDLREDDGKGVSAAVGIIIGHGEELEAKGRKRSAQEPIHDHHLTPHIDQVEELTEVEAVGVGGTPSPPLTQEVVDNLFFTDLEVAVVEGVDLEPCNENLEPPSLPNLPDVAWEVEGEGLEEKHETDPLVVAVEETPVLPPNPKDPRVGLTWPRTTTQPLPRLTTLTLIWKNGISQLGIR